MSLQAALDIRGGLVFQKVSRQLDIVLHLLLDADDLPLNVQDQLMQVAQVDLLVVHDDLNVVSRRYSTHYDAQVDPRAVQGSRMLLLLVLLLLLLLLLVLVKSTGRIGGVLSGMLRVGLSRLGTNRV